MKKVLMLVAIMLGTSVMVNAETIQAKTGPAKGIRVVNHAKRVAAKKVKAEKKMEAANMVTPEVKK
jgi:hypothetical protein